MHLLPDGSPAPDLGEIPIWDGAKWIYGQPPVIPGPRGPGGGMGMRGPTGPIGPAGPATVASVLSYEGALAADRSYSLSAFTSLFAMAPLVKVGTGSLYVEATFGATIVRDATVVENPGARFRLTFDGTPLGPGPDGRVAQVFTTRNTDPGGVQAISGGGTLQFKLDNTLAPPGAHTLVIEWAISEEANGGVAPTITAFCSPASSDWYAEIYAQEI